MTMVVNSDLLLFSNKTLLYANSRMSMSIEFDNMNVLQLNNL